MSMDWNLAVSQLRVGTLSFDDALGILAPEDRGALALAVELARLADREQAARLVDRLQAAVETMPGIQYGVGTELVRRGHWSPVLEHQWEGSLVVEFMIAATEGEGLPDADAFFAQAVVQLELALADPDANPLSVLGAKHFMARLDPSFRRELLAWLAPEVVAESAEGLYEDLDYPHGQVDPMIELARCFVGADMLDEALVQLEARDARSPRMLHLAELIDLAAISNALPLELRRTWWPRLRGWAKAADAAGPPEQGVSLEHEWVRHADALPTG